MGSSGTPLVTHAIGFMRVHGAGQDARDDLCNFGEGGRLVALLLELRRRREALRRQPPRLANQGGLCSLSWELQLLLS